MEQLNSILQKVLLLDENAMENDIPMDQIDTWDSLKHMELITTLEQELNFQLTMDEIAAMRSTGQVKAVVEQKLA